MISSPHNVDVSGRITTEKRETVSDQLELLQDPSTFLANEQTIRMIPNMGMTF